VVHNATSVANIKDKPTTRRTNKSHSASTGRALLNNVSDQCKIRCGKNRATTPSPKPTGANESDCKKPFTCDSYSGTGIPIPKRLNMLILVVSARMMSNTTQIIIMVFASFISTDH